jgi:hypothetical protein
MLTYAGEPMQQPVVAADGHTYDKSNIKGWIEYHQVQREGGREMQGGRRR